MDEIVQVSALIGGIYDAALDPTLWAGVLKNAASFVGGSAASVFAKDATKKEIQIFHQYGVDPSYQKLYVEKYVKFDPSTSSQVFAKAGDIISTESYMTYDEFLKNSFLSGVGASPALDRWRNYRAREIGHGRGDVQCLLP